jgi:hypothetical protein
MEEDVGRTLEVKHYAASRATTEPEGREAIVSLLVGERGRPVDGEEGLARVTAWQKERGDPVAEYVLGKNLANREFWVEAGGHLDRAIAIGEPTARIGRELLRERAICACALGDAEGVADVRARVEARDGAFAQSEGRKAWVVALLERCPGTTHDRP